MKCYAIPALLAALIVSPGARAQAPEGKTYLLAVSVKQYNKSHTGFIDLNAAAPDTIHALNQLCPDDVKKRTAVYLAQYKKEDGYLEPTAEGVRTALKDFATRVTAKDRVVIVMLGHGINTKKQGDIFCTSDTDFADPKSMILVSEIVERVRAMKAREKIVFIDACRKILDKYQARDTNGVPLTGTDGKPTLKEIAVDVQQPEAPTRNTVTAPIVPDKSRTVVVQSCKAGQKAYIVDSTGKAIMTSRLLEAVNGAADIGSEGGNADGVVDIAEILNYLREHVREDARTIRQEVQEIDVQDIGLGEKFSLVAYDRSKAGDKLKPAVAQSEVSPNFYNAPLGSNGDAYSSQQASYGPGIAERISENGGFPLGQALRQGSFNTGGFGGIPNPIPSQFRQYIPDGNGSLMGTLGRFLR